MLSNKIENLLTELKVNPEEFAYRIGVGKSSVYKLLRGDTKKLTSKMASKINDAFPELSLDYLLGLNYGTKKTLNEESLSESELNELALKAVINEEQLMTVKAFSNIIEIRVAKKIATLLSDEEEYIKWRNS